MMKINSSQTSNRAQKRMVVLIFLLYLAVLMIFLFMMVGCNSPSQYRLQTQFEREPHGSQVIQKKLSAHSQDRLPVGMVIVLNPDFSPAPLVVTDENWPQFAATVKHKVQGLIPVSMQDVVRIEDIPSGERGALLRRIRRNAEIEVALVVLSSSKEVKGPARFDVLPEVSFVNGSQIDNHAMVELALLDLSSGKLLLQSQGTSYATLEQLDIPLASNRYPRVRGSDQINPIYPEEGKALETLRMVALSEALDQAVLKLSTQWPEG